MLEIILYLGFQYLDSLIFFHLWINPTTSYVYIAGSIGTYYMLESAPWNMQSAMQIWYNGTNPAGWGEYWITWDITTNSVFYAPYNNPVIVTNKWSLMDTFALSEKNANTMNYDSYIATNNLDGSDTIYIIMKSKLSSSVSWLSYIWTGDSSSWTDLISSFVLPESKSSLISTWIVLPSWIELKISNIILKETNWTKQYFVKKQEEESEEAFVKRVWLVTDCNSLQYSSYLESILNKESRTLAFSGMLVWVNWTGIVTSVSKIVTTTSVKNSSSSWSESSSWKLMVLPLIFTEYAQMEFPKNITFDKIMNYNELFFKRL